MKTNSFCVHNKRSTVLMWLDSKIPYWNIDLSVLVMWKYFSLKASTLWVWSKRCPIAESCLNDLEFLEGRSGGFHCFGWNETFFDGLKPFLIRHWWNIFFEPHKNCQAQFVILRIPVTLPIWLMLFHYFCIQISITANYGVRVRQPLTGGKQHRRILDPSRSCQ